MITARPRPTLERLEDHLREREASHGVLSLVHLDVDGFRRHAVTHGSLAACGILRAVHAVLTDLMLPGDLRSRFSEHRVLVALPGRVATQGLEFAERARLRLREYRLDNSISIAVVQVGPQQFVGACDLIEVARQLVFKSKSMGGGHTLCTTLEPDAQIRHIAAQTRPQGLDSGLMSDFQASRPAGVELTS